MVYFCFSHPVFFREGWENVNADSLVTFTCIFYSLLRSRLGPAQITVICPPSPWFEGDICCCDGEIIPYCGAFRVLHEEGQR